MASSAELVRDDQLEAHDHERVAAVYRSIAGFASTDFSRTAQDVVDLVVEEVEPVITIR